MKAWELLSDESKWCKGKWAVDGNNSEVDPVSSRAVRWCLIGALRRCYPNENEMRPIFKEIQRNIILGTVTVWNDDPRRKFEEVHNILKKLDI